MQQPEEASGIIRKDGIICQNDADVPATIALAEGNRARLWIRVLSAFSIALSIDVVLTMSYIFRNDPPVVSLKTASPLLNITTIPQWKSLPEPSSIVTKVVFGSCASQEMPQPHWDSIIKYDPDLVLLMGDNVYGDCEDLSCLHLKRAYQKMAHHASVQGAAPRLSVLATLDDHDYGQESCHRDNPYKELARSYFAEFFNLASHTLPPDGVYRSFVFGPYAQRVQVILLDTRYGRSPFFATGDPEAPHKPDNSTHLRMLSEPQWQWLQTQLDMPADLRLMVSSIQVLNDGTGFEAWRQIPAERERLYSMTRGKSVIFLSGDRHVGGFYEFDNFVEVTASSFTHTVPIGALGDCQTAVECDELDPNRLGDGIRVNHFGAIEIDWSHRSFTMALRRTESSVGSTFLNHTTKHGKLSDAGQVLRQMTYKFPP